MNCDESAGRSTSSQLYVSSDTVSVDLQFVNETDNFSSSSVSKSLTEENLNIDEDKARNKHKNILFYVFLIFQFA